MKAADLVNGGISAHLVFTLTLALTSLSLSLSQLSILPRMPQGLGVLVFKIYRDME